MSIYPGMNGDPSAYTARGVSNFATAGMLAAVLAGGAVLYKAGASSPDVLNPTRPAEVISHINRFPGAFHLMLKQCGFGPQAPEADKNGCVTAEYDVTQQDFDRYQDHKSLRPEDLKQP